MTNKADEIGNAYIQMLLDKLRNEPVLIREIKNSRFPPFQHLKIELGPDVSPRQSGYSKCSVVVTDQYVQRMLVKAQKKRERQNNRIKKHKGIK